MKHSTLLPSGKDIPEGAIIEALNNLDDLFKSPIPPADRPAPMPFLAMYETAILMEYSEAQRTKMLMDKYFPDEKCSVALVGGRTFGGILNIGGDKPSETKVGVSIGCLDTTSERKHIAMDDGYDPMTQQNLILALFYKTMAQFYGLDFAHVLMAIKGRL